MRYAQPVRVSCPLIPTLSPRRYSVGKSCRSVAVQRLNRSGSASVVPVLSGYSVQVECAELHGALINPPTRCGVVVGYVVSLPPAGCVPHKGDPVNRIGDRLHRGVIPRGVR